jgi:ligand-binding sensor domain-containing protein/signal transduction histidine kinase
LEKELLLIFFLLSILSCSRQQDQKRPNSYFPKVVEAKGYVVPKDSMDDPKVTSTEEIKLDEINAGKPTVVHTNTNVHFAGIPKIVLAGKPRICIPGQDTFSLPKTVPAIDTHDVAYVQEIVIAKDAYAKDQNPQNFSSFGKLQGLKNRNISSLLEDRLGNLWFGYFGGGVTRYDGKNFTHFTDKDLYNVFSILEDKSGNLWFAGGGVTKYDGKNFTHFADKEGLSENVLSTNIVRSIAEDKSGNIWLGTNGDGVSKYDGAAFMYFTRREGLNSNFVLSILEDKYGNLWFGTDSGVSKYDGNSFKNFTAKEGFSTSGVVSMLEDKSGNLWFGTAGGGVSKYNGKTFTNYTAKEGLSYNDVRSILQDKSGSIWFGTNGGGATKFDGLTFTHFTDKEGLPNNNVTGILEDRSGNLWFGTGAGLTKYGGKTFTHFTGKEGLSNSDGVYSILEDRSGHLWFGTAGGGVSMYDGKSFTKFSEKEGLAVNVISALEDKAGNFWFGTTKGFTKYDGQVFTHFLDKDGPFNSFVFSILEDKSGDLWFGTAGGGVSKYDGKFFTKYTNINGLSEFFIRCMLQDKSGNIWFGTNEGVTKFDGKAFTNFNVKDGLANNVVPSITEDKSGNLWFGTMAGVSKYDGKFFTNFTEKEGLPSNDVWSILADKSGNIWVGTASGLSELTKEKLALFSEKLKTNTVKEGDVFFKNYTYEDGFLGIGVIGNSLCEDRNGTIWIGANDRLTAYHPTAGGEIADTVAPNIQLTTIELFNENIPWVNLLIPSPSVQAWGEVKDTSLLLGNGLKISKFKFDSLTRWYSLPENLSLAYNNNFLTFNFIGITMNQPQKVKYQYKLEGNDNHWSGITSSTKAFYSNLPPRTYTLKVKAMNSGGYWSKEFHYTFTIRPPWWKTWWAQGLYILTFLGALWSFIKWRVKTLKIEKSILEEKVATRTHELQEEKEKVERTLAQLKATQEQLMQAEKVASVVKMQQAVSNERLRISRELHDEVGATLSSISIFSQAALQKNEMGNMTESKNILERIGESSREVMGELNDTVWLINPGNDNLQKIIQRISNYALPLCRTNSINFEIKTAASVETLDVSVERRKAIYLIIKEAVNNTLKHAAAKNLVIQFEKKYKALYISIKDDGKGFDENNSSAGNGLNNMKQRANDVNGRIYFNSAPQKGTEIILQVPLTNIGD